MFLSIIEILLRSLVIVDIHQMIMLGTCKLVCIYASYDYDDDDGGSGQTNTFITWDAIH